MPGERSRSSTNALGQASLSSGVSLYLWIALSCLAGTFAIGFLAAGMLGFADLERLGSPASRTDKVFQAVDGLLFGSLGFLVSGIFENWSKERDARRMIYSGLISLAALVFFGYLAVHTG
jgi:hypothetical protein